MNNNNNVEELLLLISGIGMSSLSSVIVLIEKNSQLEHSIHVLFNVFTCTTLVLVLVCLRKKIRTLDKKSK
jgi:hypothetical protein